MDFYTLRTLVLEAPHKYLTIGQIWHHYLSGITTGIALEFGVWNGRSINNMAEIRPEASFHGFDSFEGLPEKWIPGREVGFFATDLSKLKFRENITIHPGWFQDTLPRFIIPSESRIEGVHIDCDLGSSTKTILDHLGERLIHDKSLLLFDEFYNYNGYEDHEFKAFNEWVNSSGVKFDVVARNIKHQQVLIALK